MTAPTLDIRLSSDSCAVAKAGPKVDVAIEGKPRCSVSKTPKVDVPNAAPHAAVASTPKKGDTSSSSAHRAWARVLDNSNGLSAARVAAFATAPAAPSLTSCPDVSWRGLRTGANAPRMLLDASSMRPKATDGK